MTELKASNLPPRQQRDPASPGGSLAAAAATGGPLGNGFICLPLLSREGISADAYALPDRQRRLHFRLSGAAREQGLDEESDMLEEAIFANLGSSLDRTASPQSLPASPVPRVVSPMPRVASPGLRVASPMPRVASPLAGPSSPPVRVQSPSLLGSSPVAKVLKKVPKRVKSPERVLSPGPAMPLVPPFFDNPPPYMD